MHPKACPFRRTKFIPRNTHQGLANFDIFITFVLTKNLPIMVAVAELGLIQTILKHRLTCIDPNRSKALAPAHIGAFCQFLFRWIYYCHSSKFTGKQTGKMHLCAVCWIEVKVAVLCAHQYMPWNLLLIKVLDNFWYFKHQIPTRTCSEAYL